MKKTILIFIALLVLIVVFVVAAFFLHKNPTPSPSGGSVMFPSGGVTGSTQTATSSVMAIAGADKSTILVNNFINQKDTASDPVNKGYYYLGYNTFSGQTNIPYEIEYIASTQYFNIELLQEPLGATRTAAEQDLMNRLGISESLMCDLNYTISTPNSVNSDYGGENLGFSFCPGAVELPQ